MYFALSAVGLGSTLVGLILAHTVLSVPFVLLTVLASLQSFDQTLLKAAASLGANPAIAFRRVVLPLIAPGVATGALFAFATSFDELIVAQGLVYRRDAVDRSHVGAPHQVDLWRIRSTPATSAML